MAMIGRRKAATTKLSPFVETVKMALLADARRPRKERRTAKALHHQIAAAEHKGGYTPHCHIVETGNES